MAELDEIEGLRSETARFFRDGDRGSHVVQLFSDPISFLEDGEWKPIDSTVIAAEGGFTNAAGSFDVFFPETLTPARPVTVTYEHGALSFSLVRATPSDGEAEGFTVTYPEVYPGTDLAIDVTNDGIKERAIVKSSDGSRRLTYRVETDGLDLALEDEYDETRFKRGELLEHETDHTTQSAFLGPFYETIYFSGGVLSLVTERDFACGHPLEVHAGLEDGQYSCD